MRLANCTALDRLPNISHICKGVSSLPNSDSTMFVSLFLPTVACSLLRSLSYMHTSVSKTILLPLTRHRNPPFACFSLIIAAWAS